MLKNQPTEKNTVKKSFKERQPGGKISAKAVVDELQGQVITLHDGAKFTIRRYHSETRNSEPT